MPLRVCVCDVCVCQTRNASLLWLYSLESKYSAGINEGTSNKQTQPDYRKNIEFTQRCLPRINLICLYTRNNSHGMPLGTKKSESERERKRAKTISVGEGLEIRLSTFFSAWVNEYFRCIFGCLLSFAANDESQKGVSNGAWSTTIFTAKKTFQHNLFKSQVRVNPMQMSYVVVWTRETKQVEGRERESSRQCIVDVSSFFCVFDAHILIASLAGINN